MSWYLLIVCIKKKVNSSMGGSTFYAQKYGKNWCFITNSFAFGSFSS
jgi:phage pi2 protein 07